MAPAVQNTGQNSLSVKKDRQARGFWENIMHSGLVSTTAAFGQAYIINTYSLIAILSTGVFGLLHLLVEHDGRLGWLEIADAGVIALNLLGLRLTANIALARSGFLLSVFTLLVVMVITGGTAGTGAFWVFVFPVAAFFLGGQKRGMWWTGSLVAAILALLGLAKGSIIAIAYSATEIRQLIITLLVVTIGIAVYQRSRETLQWQTATSQTALQAEKIRAETVLANIDEGVVATDSDGRIILMNQAAEDMFGWTFDQAAGKLFTDVAPLINDAGKVVAAQDRPIQQVLKYSKAINPTLTYQRKNGSTFPAVMSGRAITLNGKMVGAIGTIRDISQQVRIDRAKSEFVTLASHQLRTPISSVGWLTEMLLSGDVGPLNADQRDYIDQVYSSNQRSAEMVDAMLLVSSLELGPIQVQPEQTTIADNIHIFVELQRKRLVSNKNLTIQENYATDMPQIALDLRLTRTIFNTILSNAFKYTPDGGTITIDINLSDEKLTPDSQGSVVVTVHDTGYGIPTDEQPKLFTKLFRASNIRKRDTDGMGLGLYIVKKILQQTGGEIRFQSTENAGSTFYVVLPREGMRPHA